MKKRILKRRQWLRPNRGWGDQSTIHTDCEVFNNSWISKRKFNKYSIEASLSLRDCSNTISFSFEADNDKHYHVQRRAMLKLRDEIDTLMKAWSKGRDAICNEAGGWKQEKK